VCSLVLVTGAHSTRTLVPDRAPWVWAKPAVAGVGRVQTVGSTHCSCYSQFRQLMRGPHTPADSCQAQSIQAKRTPLCRSRASSPANFHVPIHHPLALAPDIHSLPALHLHFNCGQPPCPAILRPRPSVTRVLQVLRSIRTSSSTLGI